jgi:hypothetical protein
MEKTYTPLPGLSTQNDEKSVLTPFSDPFPDPFLPAFCDLSALHFHHPETGLEMVFELT